MERLKLPFILSSSVILIALAPMPYGYYMILRLVLFGSCAYAALQLYGTSDAWWILGLLALFYNPIIPIHLGEKALWIPINIVTLGLIYWADRKLSSISANVGQGNTNRS